MEVPDAEVTVAINSPAKLSGVDVPYAKILPFVLNSLIRLSFCWMR